MFTPAHYIQNKHRGQTPNSHGLLYALCQNIYKMRLKLTVCYIKCLLNASPDLVAVPGPPTKIWPPWKYTYTWRGTMLWHAHQHAPWPSLRPRSTWVELCVVSCIFQRIVWRGSMCKPWRQARAGGHKILGPSGWCLDVPAWAQECVLASDCCNKIIKKGYLQRQKLV